MRTKIFITPWIDLSDDDIDKCIKAGADSGRIHTGKLQSDRISSLIEYYNSRNFKFYLDLRGNKASISKINEGKGTDVIKKGQLISISEGDLPEKIRKGYDHNLLFTLIPKAVRSEVKGDIAFDDGKVLVEILELKGHQGIPYLRTIVTKAGSIFIGDGVSSTNIFIHSGDPEPFSQVDIAILKRIPERLRNTIKFVDVSFVESIEQIKKATYILKSLGFNEAQVVPKIETIKGIENISDICKYLKKIYGDKAELHIGRADLTMDCGRSDKKVDPLELVIKAVKICNQYRVKISVLALSMISIKDRMKSGEKNVEYLPSDREMKNILILKELGIYQLGLTNDMYLDKPEELIRNLRRILR